MPNLHALSLALRACSPCRVRGQRSRRAELDDVAARKSDDVARAEQPIALAGRFAGGQPSRSERFRFALDPARHESEWGVTWEENTTRLSRVFLGAAAAVLERVLSDLSRLPLPLGQSRRARLRVRRRPR